MKRTSIRLPDDLDARLRREARRRGVTVADVVRTLLDAYLPSAPQSVSLRFAAIGDGDPPDASERVDGILRDALTRRAHLR